MLKLTLIFSIFYVISCNGQQWPYIADYNGQRPYIPVFNGEQRPYTPVLNIQQQPFIPVHDVPQQRYIPYMFNILGMYNLDPSEEETLIRTKRQNFNSAPPFCGATAFKQNMSLPRIYGNWYPIQASKMAYQLWMTSLYGEVANDAIICPIWNFQLGQEINTLSIEVSHREKSITMEAFLLENSKWVMTWPNGEDTLTSVVAAGSHSGNKNSYDWLLTMDCDLNGVVSSDWAVFSRKSEISPKSLAAITAIAHGIEGLQTKEMVKTGESC